jgi:hypothetical protein
MSTLGAMSEETAGSVEGPAESVEGRAGPQRAAGAATTAGARTPAGTGAAAGTGPESGYADCVLCGEPTEYPETVRGATLCPVCEWQEAQRTACPG